MEGERDMSVYSVSFSKEKRIQSVVQEGPLMIKALSLSVGESLTRHNTPNVLYLQCLKGMPTITLHNPEETIKLESQQILRIDAKREHAVDAGEEDALLLLHLVKGE